MITPSNCPHFPQCSGCELANPFHPPIWDEARAFFREAGVEPEFFIDGFSQTRIRAKLAIRQGPKIGLFKKGSHDVISIPNCLVHHPSINQAAAILNEEIERGGITPYSESTGTGTLRYAQFFVERSTGKVQLTLVTTEEVDQLCKELKKYDLWHSIWQNIHPNPTNVIFGPTWKLFSGEPFLWQTICERKFPFHPAAFSQTHLPLFEKMIERIKSWVQPNDRVIELYAGIGVIGLSLGVKSLTLVENNPYAHLSFLELKANASYLCIDAKEAPLADSDLIIVDPPRKGLDPEMIPKIESTRLVYVSCQFKSFRRDSETLFSLGWTLKEGAGYLLFPGTNHVEIVALFVRK